MGYLDKKIVIYLVSNDGIKRFFNRKTQGFTVRLSKEGRFYESSDCSINVYFNSFRKHSQSEHIWFKMLDNDEELHYCKATIKSLMGKES